MPTSPTIIWRVELAGETRQVHELAAAQRERLGTDGPRRPWPRCEPHEDRLHEQPARVDVRDDDDEHDERG